MRVTKRSLLFAVLLVVVLAGCDGLLGVPDDSGVQRKALDIVEGARSRKVEPSGARQELLALLRDVEDTKVRDARNVLAYSDAAFVCVLLMEIDSSEVERCKRIYRRAIDVSRERSDPAPVFNSAGMLRSIKDDDAVRWIFGIGLLGDRVMTKWAIETISDLAEDVERVDRQRAGFLIRNLSKFCNEEGLFEEDRRHCKQIVDGHSAHIDMQAAQGGR
jgi:hypothetical protein